MGNMTDDDMTALEKERPRSPAPPGDSMRMRIIEAAAELFYAQGLRAVSAEKIIAQVGITKVTFYRHFPAKDDLIVAYLERRAKWERDAIAQVRRAANDVPDALRIIAGAIGAETCSPGFRGCPFINAAAEYADPSHPVRRAVDAHRRWFRQTIQDLLAELDVPDSAAAADQLVMLRDGAMVSGYLGDSGSVAAALRNAASAVVAFSNQPAEQVKVPAMSSLVFEKAFE
jgi:AcrR family transcriptional regulator